MIDLSFRKLARVQRFTDFRELETQVGRRLANNALKQLDGWALVSDGAITLKGYGVYLDLESINIDFLVSAKKPKPMLRDFALSEKTVARIREDQKSRHQSALDSWKLGNELRAESQKRLKEARRRFRKYGILLVVVDLGSYAPRVETQRHSFGSMH